MSVRLLAPEEGIVGLVRLLPSRSKVVRSQAHGLDSSTTSFGPTSVVVADGPS